jgi:hypothetical protein
LSSGGKYVAAAIIGGVASKLGGGKFENGALTAAFGHLFNEVDVTYDKRTGTLSILDRETGGSFTAKVFSGDPTHGAIEDGQYDILSYKNRSDRYRLEPLDSVYGDDIHNATGRNEFRLHPRGFGINWGCISAADGSSWSTIEGALQGTSTSVVDVISKPNRFGVGGGQAEQATKFGTLRVFSSTPTESLNPRAIR